MNNITTLREHLFKAMQGVSDGSMTVEKAKAVSDISQTIINSAKVEVDFIKASGKTSSSDNSFFKQALPPGITNIRTHQIK